MRTRYIWKYDSDETEGVNAFCAFYVSLANLQILDEEMSFQQVRDFDKRRKYADGIKT